jgi:hypothetical protein
MNLAALVLAAVASGDERAVESAAYGFRFARPSDEWITYTEEHPSGALFATSTFPRGSSGLPSVVVYVSAWDEAKSLEAIRDAAVAELAKKNAREITRGATRLADRDALWIHGRMTLESGVDADFRYAYVASKPYLYLLQSARAASDEPAAAPLDAIEKSFELFPPKPPAEDPKRAAWKRLADRCGSEIAWAATWDDAAKRAAAEKKLVLAVYENYAALGLPQTAVTGALMDPDVLAIVNERYVGFRMSAATEAPFRDAGAFGMGKHAWGTAFLVVRPDATVARSTDALDASLLADFLREGAEAPPSDGDRLALAEACLRRGDLADARRSLEGATGPRARWLRARVCRQLRDGPGALDELRAASDGADRALAPEIAADEALIRMRLGQPEDAERGFDRVLHDWPDSPRAREAAFWLGAFERLRSGGATRWEALALAHPDDRFAWKAAANLLGAGAFINGVERLEWPGADLLAAVARPKTGSLPLAEAARAERDAVAYLVASQRADGSWIVPLDALSFDANLYTTPVAAIAGWSLLSVDDDGARRAAKRALDYVLDRQRTGRLEPGSDIAGVYSIWGRTFVLRFLAECVRARVGDSAELRRAIDALVASIAKSQHPRGGWPYVSLPGSDPKSGLDPSSSFLTAGVVLVLLDAKAAGASVPADALDSGLRFLDRLRGDDGVYRYMPDLPGSRSADGIAEAAGRGPLCALALQRGGVAGVERVRDALRIFADHREAFRKEWHKVLCHTGQEGLGAHYLLYDYWHAAAALRVLPAAERPALRDAILADLLAARFADGSFEDLPGLGRAWGTAATLLALRELRAP